MVAMLKLKMALRGFDINRVKQAERANAESTKEGRIVKRIKNRREKMRSVSRMRNMLLECFRNGGECYRIFNCSFLQTVFFFTFRFP